MLLVHKASQFAKHEGLLAKFANPFYFFFCITTLWGVLLAQVSARGSSFARQNQEVWALPVQSKVINILRRLMRFKVLTETMKQVWSSPPPQPVAVSPLPLFLWVGEVVKLGRGMWMRPTMLGCSSSTFSSDFSSSSSSPLSHTLLSDGYSYVLWRLDSLKEILSCKREPQRWKC